MKQTDKTVVAKHLPAVPVLLASIYYLMTRYARLPDEQIANAIAEHFEILGRHPDCDSEILKRAGERLSLQWREHLAPLNSTDNCRSLLNAAQDTRHLH